MSLFHFLNEYVGSRSDANHYTTTQQSTCIPSAFTFNDFPVILRAHTLKETQHLHNPHLSQLQKLFCQIASVWESELITAFQWFWNNCFSNAGVKMWSLKQSASIDRRPSHCVVQGAWRLITWFTIIVISWKYSKIFQNVKERTTQFFNVSDLDKQNATREYIVYRPKRFKCTYLE